MNRANDTSASLQIEIAATFTAEPLADVLGFWMAELDVHAELAFAPHGQVFQQLLGAHDEPTGNQPGIQVLLVRLADWLEPATASPVAAPQDARDVGRRTARPVDAQVTDLAAAVRAAAARRAIPHLLFVCPSPAAAAGSLHAAEARLAKELDGVPGVHVVPSAEVAARHPAGDWHDPYAEQLGRVPYTTEAFAALGTAVARTVHAHLTPRPKVIVADCDNTLWDGVVAEDGTTEVRVPPARRELQELLVAQVRAGRLLCLCSRNDPADVTEVLERHPGMALRAEHVTAVRANWQPKADNLRSLADELGLGLDSFVFLDDSPVEVAGVRAAVPEVTALHLPGDADAAVAFLRHCWPLDLVGVTGADAGRTRAYREHRRREEVRQASMTLADFLDRLQLHVTVRPPRGQELDRVAQLTQRTSQLNLAGIRRTAGEVARLPDDGRECLVVDVSDRFGAYGLVGVLIFAAGPAALTVDTFLLSCRALGRGVEHRMLAHLGTLARDRGATEVTLAYTPAPRNAPAVEFLSSLGGRWVDGDGGSRRLLLTADQAAAARYDPEVPARPARPAPAAAGAGAAPHAALPPAPSDRVGRIATELATPVRVLAAVDAWRHGPAARGDAGPGDAAPRDAVAARTPAEAKVMELWAALLASPPSSVHDDFFELGGDSLLLVQFMGQVRREFGVELPVTVLFASDFTIAGVAAAIEDAQRGGAAAAADDLDDLLAELQALPEEDLDAVLGGERPLPAD